MTKNPLAPKHGEHQIVVANPPFGNKATELEMSNDEFGMSNCLNFGIRTSAFEIRSGALEALVGNPKRNDL